DYGGGDRGGVADHDRRLALAERRDRSLIVHPRHALVVAAEAGEARHVLDGPIGIPGEDQQPLGLPPAGQDAARGQDYQASDLRLGRLPFRGAAANPGLDGAVLARVLPEADTALVRNLERRLAQQQAGSRILAVQAPAAPIPDDGPVVL